MATFKSSKIVKSSLKKDLIPFPIYSLLSSDIFGFSFTYILYLGTSLVKL